jgi:hypothetical protein
MSTLAEIENAADQLPPSQMEELVAFLMSRLQRVAARKGVEQPARRSRRGFPVSRGRVAFGAAEVAQIEAAE